MEAYNISLYSLAYLNKDIDIRANLLNKTWRVFNDSDVKETCTFNEDGSLTIVKDGVEKIMSWSVSRDLEDVDYYILVGEEKLYPSYKDNILFVLRVPDKGNVFLIDEDNELSIIPKTKLDLFNYFQKADLVYNRFSYPVYHSPKLHIFEAFVIILLIIFFVLVLCFDLVQRVFVEFGFDNITQTHFIILGIMGVLLGLVINAYWGEKYDKLYKREILTSKENWIEDNANDERWKQYGKSLFTYCPAGTLRLKLSGWEEGEIDPSCIGFNDENIKTRDQLLKVNKEVRGLRALLCNYKWKKYLFYIIPILVCLATFGFTVIGMMNYGKQLPYFSMDGILWGANIFPLLFYYFAPAILALSVSHFLLYYLFYKKDRRKITKWISQNPTDWRVKYVQFKNLYSYSLWTKL